MNTPLMDTVDPRFLHAFAWEDYDWLFRHCRDYVSPEASESVHLASIGKKKSWWVVALPQTTRTAKVLWSNFLPFGAEVRSKMALSHAARRRRWDSLDTVSDPRWLDVTWLPPQKGRTKSRLMRRMRPSSPRRAA